MINKNYFFKYKTIKHKKISTDFIFIKKFFNFALLAFLIDVILYTLLNPLFGFNTSLFISFIVSQLSLFIFLKKVMISKFKNNLNGFSKQIIIALISYFIHFSIINLFYFFNNFFEFISSFHMVTYKYLISVSLKIICGIFGFLNSSFLINKFLFKIKISEK